MRGHVAETGAISALAAVVTAVIAASVLRAPSERVFGVELVGRHHDPFTVMAQFERPVGFGVFSQPVTDIAGALLARMSGGVAAYNWVVLLSYPLSAAAAYLLARHLLLSPAGASLAAMAYAFSPFHLAQSAYHPHVAQVHWLPVYLLALWRCLDVASPAAMRLLAASTMGVTLSNFYGGFVTAVITPVAVAAYWLVTRRAGTRGGWRLAVTVGGLLAMAGAGIAYISHVAGALLVSRETYAFSRADLFIYSAKWWSYLVPPAEHPLLGESVRRFWSAAGIREGLLEQQVSLGWGIVSLGLIAVWSWSTRRPAMPSLSRVPILVVVALTALVCSLSPERAIGPFTFVRPSALLYPLAPMFRSYARFGQVVQLMAALLAGIGVDLLRRAGSQRARIACVALVILAAAEYAVWPPAMWRDVLPTSAHRWVARQPGHVRALDCVPLTQESASVAWLTQDRVSLLGATVEDCTDANLADTLAANGFTHLLLRRGTAARRWFAAQEAPPGLRAAARLNGGDVYAVTADVPPIYTAAMRGFSPRERDAGWAWRWMGTDAAWTVVNTTPRRVVAMLDLELSAFRRARSIGMLLDGRPVQVIHVEQDRRVYRVGPMDVAPGSHDLIFRPAESPTFASDTSDRRPLSFALGAWTWTMRSEEP